MKSMFAGTRDFRGDISKWGVSRVTGISNIVSGANSYLSGWDISNSTTMAFMFSGAISFSGDISKWGVSRVMDMSLIVSGAKSYLWVGRIK